MSKNPKPPEPQNENCLKGMRCPKCKSLEPFRIAAHVLLVVNDEGSDGNDSDHEWDGESFCRCLECFFEGKVKDFYTMENKKGGANG